VNFFCSEKDSFMKDRKGLGVAGKGVFLSLKRHVKEENARKNKPSVNQSKIAEKRERGGAGCANWGFENKERLTGGVGKTLC